MEEREREGKRGGRKLEGRGGKRDRRKEKGREERERRERDGGGGGGGSEKEGRMEIKNLAATKITGL